jgi:hypothetical protein
MTLTSSALRNDLHGGIYHKAVLDALLVGLTHCCIATIKTPGDDN